MAESKRLTLEDAASLFPDEGKLIPLPNTSVANKSLDSSKEIEIETTPNLDATPLTFGKYIGETPNNVADTDPHWLSWAFSTVHNRPTCTLDLAEWCRKQPKNKR